MTSIRGKGVFAALAVCVVLLVPTAAATAGDSYSTSTASDGSSLARRAPFSVSFTSLTRNGHVVAVKKFKFRGVNAKCKVGNKVEVRGHAPRMHVHHRKFRSKIRKHGGKVRINGKFKHHGRKVVGRIRVNGKFDHGHAKGCVGVRHFSASQN